MKDKIKVTLAPADWQVQLLLETIDMHCKMCDYISCIVHKRDSRKPRNLYYWVVDGYHKNFYQAIRHEFPKINTNLIPLAFRKIAKAYKKWPCEPYKFCGTLDCSNYTLSIKFVLPSPNNIGMLTISTLAGRLSMHFIFDDTQRKELSVAFNKKRFREYELVYQDDQFHLITDVYDQKIKPTGPKPMPDCQSSNNTCYQ